LSQFWPADDPFTDAVAPRDVRWNAYGRVALWNTTPSYASGGPGVQQNFAAAGRLFNGWFGHLPTPPPGASATPATSAVRISSLPATTHNVEGYFWRQLALVDCSVEASWQIQSDNVVGAASGIQFAAGVIARLQAGTYTGTDEAMILGGSVNAYLFVVLTPGDDALRHQVRVAPDQRRRADSPDRHADGRLHVRLLLERIVPLASARAHDGGERGARRSGQVLQAPRERPRGDAGLQLPRFGGSKITTTGRVGVLLSNERKPSGSFLSAPCLNWWQAATPDNTTTIYLRDEWVRTNPQGSLFLDATTAWRTGYSLMSSWYGDLFSASGVWPYAVGEVMWHDGPASGLDRLVFFPSATPPTTSTGS
jgi:hypothetical protein